MYKIALFFTVLAVSGFSLACGSADSTNAATNVNANRTVAVDPANMPAGINTGQIPPSSNSTPGIPPVISNLPRGATPTPGIPDAANLKRGLKPGATPTPGIPSPEEIRRQMGRISNLNVNAPANTPTMKKDANKVPYRPHQ